MGGHAPLAPSSSDRWMSCTASAALIPMVETTSRAAERGTHLHEIAATLLEMLFMGDKGFYIEPGIVEPSFAMKIPEYVELLDNDTDGAEQVIAYAQYCQTLVAEGIRKDPDFSKECIFIEARVSLTDMCYGTTDFSVKVLTVLHVADLKTGHTEVPVEDNKQLMTYAGGVVLMLDFLPCGEPVKKVKAHIVQSTAGDPKSCDIPLKTIRSHIKEVEKVEAKIVSGEVQFVASNKNCKYCEAAMFCWHGRRAMNTPPKASIRDVSPDQLSELYQQAKLSATVAGQVVEDIYQLTVDEGLLMTDFTLSPGRKNRHFADKDEAAKLMVEAGIPKDKTHKRTLLTVKQALDMAKKPEILEPHIVIKRPKPSLKHTPGKSENLVNQVALDDFSDLLEGEPKNG